MLRFSIAGAALCAVLMVTGCSTKPKPAPEPDMSHLVPVNKTVPSDLYGTPVESNNAKEAVSQ